MTDRKVRILITDDQPSNIEILIELLRETYSIQIATSGQKAIDIINGDKQPDLILLDVMMPVMDGHEVLKRIKSEEKTKDIPVIFITASESEELEEAALAYGAVDYIIKPFNPKIVKQRIKNQLELKKYHEIISAELEVKNSELYEQNIQLKNYQTVFSNLQEGLLVTDKDKSIIWVNESLNDMMGYSYDEMMGQRLDIIKSGYHNEAFYKDMNGEIDRNGFWKGPIYDRTKSGEIIGNTVSIFRSDLESGDYYFIAIYSS
ncbi:MAG: response regulator [Vallitaleaceae bacterium]|jgi:PAS domain S-box-containing protein|nr:response regulator [Vallitaleaceae bacterium]